jgi:hypothetical protein
MIAIPFFIGRTVSYSFWGMTASAVARRITLESTDALSYLSIYFVISQIALLSVIYIFMRIDWRMLFAERKLKWMTKTPGRTQDLS